MIFSVQHFSASVQKTALSAQKTALSAQKTTPIYQKTIPLSALALAITTASAAQMAHAEEVATLPTTTVWGTKVFSTSEAMGEQDIAARQADHLADLLRDQAGVDVGGTHSVNQRINIRGLEDTDIEITLDGANQNAFVFHHAGNLIFNADILKSVETRVGNNSVVHGGLGGSMAMQTKDPSDLLRAGERAGVRLHGSTSTNKAATGSVTLYGKTDGGLDGLLYTTYLDRKNPEDGTGTKMAGHEGEIKNALAKVGFNFGSAGVHRVELSHDWYKDEGDYAPRPDMGVRTNLAISGNEAIPTRYERNTTALNYEGEFGENHSLDAHLSVNQLDFNRDYFEEGKRVYYGAEATNTRFNLTAMSDVALGSTTHGLTYGLDVLNQESEAARSEPTKQESSLNTAVFVEDNIAIGSKLNLIPGVRFENYKSDSATSNKTFNEVLGALAIEGKLTDGLTARLSARQLFKGPELAEIFINQSNRLVTNPDIKPETGLNTEAGFEYNRRDVLGLDALNVKLTGFQTDIKDSIVSADYPYDDKEGRGAPAWFVNGEDLKLTGGEFSAYFKKGNGGVKVSYATSDSEYKDSGEPVDRELGDKLVVGVDYAMPTSGLTMNFTGIKVFEEDHTTTPNQVKKGYFVANASLGWVPTGLPDLSLNLAVDNLFDEKYVSHASRVGSSNHPRFGKLVLDDYEPGRNVKLSASYQF